MKIYTPHPKQRHGKHTVFVTPGAKNPDTAAFMRENEKGEKVPRMFTIIFQDGVAEVDDSLGKWMIDNKQANKSKRLIQLLGEASA